jgi:hypothetical protein
MLHEDVSSITSRYKFILLSALYVFQSYIFLKYKGFITKYSNKMLSPLRLLHAYLILLFLIFLL